MPENSQETRTARITQYKSLEDIPGWVFEAKIGDMCNVATEIIHVLGVDHDTGEEQFREATWTAGTHDTYFELSEELYGDEAPIHCLTVYEDDQETIRETFKIDADNTSVTYAFKDGELIDYYPDGDFEFWSHLMTGMRRHLKTAPIAYDRVKIDESWHKIFKDMLVNEASREAEVVSFVEKNIDFRRLPKYIMQIVFQKYQLDPAATRASARIARDRIQERDDGEA